jgi:hypothetical protein
MSGSCPCVNARDGVFVLAACVYAAYWSRIFLGTDFWPLLAEFMQAPLDPPLAFAIWGAVVVAGCALLIAGIRENLEDGHGAPVLSSLVAIFASAVAIRHGWYLPADIGRLAPFISQGVYVALIAASCANLFMAVAARVRARRAALAALRPVRGVDDTALAEYSEVLAAYVERDGQNQRALAEAALQIEALTSQLAAARLVPDPVNKNLTADNIDMQAVLKFPGVRAALLHALHSDHHAGVSVTERHARDEMVAKLTVVFKRIGAPVR